MGDAHGPTAEAPDWDNTADASHSPLKIVRVKRKRKADAPDDLGECQFS